MSGMEVVILMAENDRFLLPPRNPGMADRIHYSPLNHLQKQNNKCRLDIEEYII